MGKIRQKTRITSKIDELPFPVKVKVDEMLMDTSNTYQNISDFLKKEGYSISRSAVGRYAIRSNTAMQRMLEAQAQTEKLVQVVQKNPDADYTEAGMRLLMDGLVNKLVMAEEEFDTMPLDKAGRLVASLARTKTYKDKIRHDMQKKAEIALKEFEEDIMKLIKQDPESVEQFRRVLDKVKQRMMEDD